MATKLICSFKKEKKQQQRQSQLDVCAQLMIILTSSDLVQTWKNGFCSKYVAAATITTTRKLSGLKLI